MDQMGISNFEIIYSQKSNKKEKAKIALYFEIGAYNDEGLAGIAHFIEHMLVMGLNEYPIYLNNEIIVSATTDIFATIYYIECKNTYIEICKALKVAELIVSGKSLSMFYMDFVREDVLKEYELYMSKIKNNPNWMLFNQLDLSINLPIGNLNVIENIQFSDLVCFFNHHYTACKKKMVIVGKYDNKTILQTQSQGNIYKKNDEILWMEYNIKKYTFQNHSYLYFAWGNLFQLKCSIEKLEIIRIVFLLIAKKYYNDIITFFNLCSYGKGGFFFLLSVRKGDLLRSDRLVKNIIMHINNAFFTLAKKKYYHQRIKQKRRIDGELQDILFSIKNDIQINEKKMIKTILKNYSYSEFIGIINQVFEI